MKVSFAVPAFESIGVECLSAYLKQHGHTTHLAFDPQLFGNVFLNRPLLSRIFNDQDRLLSEIVEARPDLVAFTVTGFDMPWAVRIATAIKEQTGLPIVFGGSQAWICPDQVTAFEVVDFMVLGEGEEPLLAILEHLESGSPETPLPNTWFRHSGDIVKGEMRPPSFDLDELPFPDKALFYDRLEHLYGYNMTTSRLCHRSCAYCYYNVVKRLYYAKWHFRRRSVGSVLAELEQAESFYRGQSVRFYDNNFAEDPAWLSEFADGYAEKVGVPYHAQANPDSLTPQAIEDLRRSGCFELQVGVQTIKPETKRAIGRIESLDQIRNMISGTRKAGIRCTVDLIFGLPGEDENDALEAAVFFNKNRPTKLNIYWLDYLPHSDIVQMAFEHGDLTEKQLEEVNRGDSMASMFQGGQTLESHRNLLRIQMLMTLLPIVPPRVFDWIRRRLLKYFPENIGPALMWTVVSLVIRSPLDLNRKRYAKMHREFALRILRGRFQSVGKRLFGATRIPHEKERGS